MFNLLQAFNITLKLQSREMDFERNAGADSDKLMVASSNFFRTLPGLEESSIDSKGFIVSKKELEKNSLPIPKRGDVFFDAELGAHSITEVEPLIILSKVAAYRIRTG